MSKTPDTPAVRKAVAFVHEGLEAGTWRPGDRLPASRRLAELAGVSPATMIRAVKVLKDVHDEMDAAPDPVVDAEDASDPEEDGGGDAVEDAVEDVEEDAGDDAEDAEDDPVPDPAIEPVVDMEEEEIIVILYGPPVA